MAFNGREGVEQALTGGFDLVLMDIQMPIMDGLDATRSIRADRRFSKMPIIAMTAHAMTGDRNQSLDAGMNDHLTKPINPDRLTEALLRWMPARPAQMSRPTW
jgi:CheY-like chemotaxis protein